MNETPIEVPLIDRSKEELVAIIGRLKENLSWYVEERNRLIEESRGQPDAIDLTREVECSCDPMYAHHCLKCGGRGYVKRKADPPKGNENV